MKFRPIRWIGCLLKKFPNQRIHDISKALPKTLTSPKQYSNHILVQCVYDQYYLCIFSELIYQISKRGALKVDLAITRSIESDFGHSFIAYVKRSFCYNFLLSRQWINAYSPIGARVGYRSTSWRYPIRDSVAFFKSIFIWTRLGNSSNLEQLKIDGLFCGDLIIDTYLRFRPSASVILSDTFLLYVIWQTLRDITRSRAYFQKNHPELYLTSYTTYIQHGISARVALDHGVKVISFGNLQQLGKSITKDDFYHTKNPINYKNSFLKMEKTQQQMLINHAKTQLELRLAGGVDEATAYMRRSAYSSKYSEDCPDVKGAVVVFLHDFYDSPHVYPDFIFPDFWSWICFTIETLLFARAVFFLKTHPNQVGENIEVICRLKEKYPQVCFISEKITNTQLVNAGMCCGITVYGTVAHELAFLGVPSVACARHPHISFGFCKTAHSRGEYRNLLLSVSSLTLADPIQAREEALQFYVMHNLDGGGDAIEARVALARLFKVCHQSDSSVSDTLSAASELSSSKGFNQFAASLI